MLTLKSDLRVPQTGKVIFDENASLWYNNEIGAFEFRIDNQEVFNINKDGTTPNDVNITEINGNTIDTKNGAADEGTIRVCLASDSPLGTVATIDTITNTVAVSIDTNDISNGPIPTSVSNFPTTQAVSIDTNDIANGPIPTSVSNFPTTQGVNLTQVNSSAISLGTSAVTANTPAVILTNDYLSTVLNQQPIDLLTYRKSQLYFSSSVTGGSLTHNLAFKLATTSPLSPPDLVTSVSFLGGSTIHIVSVELMIRLGTTGTFHDVGWGTGSSELTTGFGIYYKTTSGGAEIPIVNDGTVTNELPADPIKGNAALFRAFWEYQMFDPGAGQQTMKYRRMYSPPLKIDNTGGYYLRFGKEDLDTNNVSKFYVTINYYS